MSTNASTRASDGIVWRIVLKHNKLHYLCLLRLYPHTTAPVVLKRILDIYDKEQPLWCRLLCCPVVKIATLAPTNEAMYRYYNGQEVFVSGQHCDHALTSALRRPNTLSSAINFIADHQTFAVGGDSPAPRAILLRRELTDTGIVLLATAVVLIIVGPGVILGVLTKQAELGIGLSAAIAAVFGLVGLFRKKGQDSIV